MSVTNSSFLLAIVAMPTNSHAGACLAGGSGGSSTPLRSGITANGSCVTAIVTDKQQLVAKTNNKLTGLTPNGNFSSLLGLKQPSLSSSCLQERVNEGRGQHFGGGAKIFCTFGSAPPFPKSWTRPCSTYTLNA